MVEEPGANFFAELELDGLFVEVGLLAESGDLLVAGVGLVLFLKIVVHEGEELDIGALLGSLFLSLGSLFSRGSLLRDKLFKCLLPVPAFSPVYRLFGLNIRVYVFHNLNV